MTDLAPELRRALAVLARHGCTCAGRRWRRFGLALLITEPGGRPGYCRATCYRRPDEVLRLAERLEREEDELI